MNTRFPFNVPHNKCFLFGDQAKEAGESVKVNCLSVINLKFEEFGCKIVSDLLDPPTAINPPASFIAQSAQVGTSLMPFVCKLVKDNICALPCFNI